MEEASLKKIGLAVNIDWGGVTLAAQGNEHHIREIRTRIVGAHEKFARELKAMIKEMQGETSEDLKAKHTEFYESAKKQTRIQWREKALQGVLLAKPLRQNRLEERNKFIKEKQCQLIERNRLEYCELLSAYEKELPSRLEEQCRDYFADKFPAGAPKALQKMMEDITERASKVMNAEVSVDEQAANLVREESDSRPASSLFRRDSIKRDASQRMSDSSQEQPAMTPASPRTSVLLRQRMTNRRKSWHRKISI
jgi:hypothetical protein